MDGALILGFLGLFFAAILGAALFWLNRITAGLSRSFLEQQGRWERSQAAARQELQERLLSLETQMNQRLGENLREGFRHFEKVEAGLRAAEEKLQAVGRVGESISDLNRLLKLPHLRGGFGEAQLERLLADFLPTTAYELQYRIDPAGTERVDAIVRMARQVLPIDSKFPREQVLPLFESDEPAAIAEARRILSDFVRSEARQIARKYIRPELGTTDLALLFLPSEVLYFEVVRDARLFEELTRLRVHPVSPNTLAVALRSVAMAQEYYDLARGVEDTVEEIRKARRHHQHFEQRFEELGRSLRRAQECWDVAQIHLGRYSTQIHRMLGEEASPLGSRGDSPAPAQQPPQENPQARHRPDPEIIPPAGG